jgi:hypothetical protein
MVTPADITLFNAEQLLDDRTVDVTVREVLAYVIDGDIWQDGTAWRGPVPTGSDATTITAEIRRGLAGANLVGELVGRHVAGVIGREPSWSLAGLADADVEAVTSWWDRLGLIATLRLAVTRALCGDVPVLRLLVPVAPLRRPATFGEAIDMLAVDLLDSSQAVEIRDPGAGLYLGVAVYDATARTLGGRIGLAAPTLTAEMTYLDGDATAVRVVGQNGDEITLLPLGGRLTMHALDEVPTLAGQSICGIQGQLTLALTSMGRNTQSAGFVERVFLNAARPVAADGSVLPYRAGATTSNWLVGVPDADGTPVPVSMYVRNPSDPAAFTSTSDALIYHAHKEARQLHALIGGDATASGESRRQAAADFEASLGPTARAVERAVRWLLETSIAYALYLRGTATPPDMRASVTCVLSAAVPSVAEITEAREGVGAGLLSRERYQTLSGVDDPEAEDREIKDEAGETTEESAPGDAESDAPDTEDMMEDTTNG